jgi:hypothetical protein
MWNEFDNRGRSLRPTTPVNDTSNKEFSIPLIPMVIDGDYYDDKQEGSNNHENHDDCDERAESSSENNNLLKSENESLYDSFDDNNMFKILQKGLYSSDDQASDNSINLIEGNIL